MRFSFHSKEILNKIDVKMMRDDDDEGMKKLIVVFIFMNALMHI
jgi:hypothetical protein